MVEVGQAETTLDPCQLSGEHGGRSFRLAGRLLTTRLLASLLSRTTSISPAPTTELAATRSTPRRHCRHRRGLGTIHQLGHGGRETRLHAVQRPQRVGLLGKSLTFWWSSSPRVIRSSAGSHSRNK
jgi:hypothetical protein